METIIVRNQTGQVVDTFNMAGILLKYAEKKAAQVRLKYLKLGYTVTIIYNQ
jgi:hypothetical protein